MNEGAKTNQSAICVCAAASAERIANGVKLRHAYICRCTKEAPGTTRDWHCEMGLMPVDRCLAPRPAANAALRVLP